MKVWVYVEGPADRSGLEALWDGWRQKLKQAGWGIHVIPLDGKDKFFRKIGAHAVEKLIADSRDLVVGLPDYYPNQPYLGTRYQHATLKALLDVQQKLVRDTLESRRCDAGTFLGRFHASSLKHDLEMLLLAARGQLCAHLGTPDHLGHWRRPVEDQNHDRPPKRVVEELYLQKKGRAYRDTKDAPAVLASVSDPRQLLYLESGQLQCPVFKEMLDWLAEKTGVSAY
ncbi:MAG: hypothetical protein NTZ17_06295 [Phycisphaerae bacterium]|nr:hypothetical protein [Phycisphaerae bacterium]